MPRLARLHRALGAVAIASIAVACATVTPAPTPAQPTPFLVTSPTALVAPPATDAVPSAGSPSATPAPPTAVPSRLVPTATAVPPTLVPTTTAVPPTRVPTATAVPHLDVTTVRPNELGYIPILEYHLIGEPEERWQRTPANLRRDLERLHRAKYRLVRLRDVLDNKIDLPPGYSPAVLTFDDSSPGQFRFIKRGDKLEVDPTSAVGVLEQFYREHPDFGRAATFFVLPAADPPHNFFGQDEYQKEKLKYLVEHDMDIGNHTYWHQELGSVPEAEVRKQLGLAVASIQAAVPGYTVDVLALPLGVWPKDKAFALAGEWEGTRYQNRAVLLVGAEPTAPPGHAEFDPFAIPRIQAIQEQLDFWLDRLDQGVRPRYVSDGDPDRLTFPDSAGKMYRAEPGHRPAPAPGPGYQAIQLR